MVDVKICGLTTPETVSASVQAGARFVGFVFVPTSPRVVDVRIAVQLARMVPTGVRIVGLFADPDIPTLDTVTRAMPLDMIQLHGSESPGRIHEIRTRYNTPVMKAIRVAGPEDLIDIAGYEAAADWLLFDTKSALASGGTGQAFDWQILKGRTFSRPWMLAGGLNADNVGQALDMLTPHAVDVSSGVESSIGVKDTCKIDAFMHAIRHAKHTTKK